MPIPRCVIPNFRDRRALLPKPQGARVRRRRRGANLPRAARPRAGAAGLPRRAGPRKPRALSPRLSQFQSFRVPGRVECLGFLFVLEEERTTRELFVRFRFQQDRTSIDGFISDPAWVCIE